MRGHGAPLGRWLGTQRGRRKKRGSRTDDGRGLIVLVGGVQKARQKRGVWGAGRLGRSPPGHSVGGARGAWAHPWHLENPQALGTNPCDRQWVTARPSRRAPFPGPARPFRKWGSAPFTPWQHARAPHIYFTALGRCWGGSSVDTGRGEVGGPAATPLKKYKMKRPFPTKKKLKN